MAFREIGLLLTIVIFAAEGKPFGFSNCNRTTTPIQIEYIRIGLSYENSTQAFPNVTFRGSYFNNGYMASNATVNGTRFRVRFRLYKKVGVELPDTYVTVPCIDQIGSCTYYINCTEFYGCPWPSEFQRLSTRIVQIPPTFEIPLLLRSIIVFGRYRFKMALYEEGTDLRVACIRGEILLKF